MKRPWSSARFWSGVYSLPVFRSITTACRCTKVPRRESCPASRTSRPSIVSEPNASSSAKAQSTLPSRLIFSRRSNTGLTRGCGVKPSGRLTWASAIRRTTSSGTPVSSLVGTTCSDSTEGLGAGGCFSSSRTSLKTYSSWLA